MTISLFSQQLSMQYKLLRHIRDTIQGHWHWQLMMGHGLPRLITRLANGDHITLTITNEDTVTILQLNSRDSRADLQDIPISDPELIQKINQATQTIASYQ